MSRSPHAPLRGLYAITQEGLSEAQLFGKTEAIVANGARLLQYRDKSRDARKRLAQARWLQQCCQQYGCHFLVNDDIELAAAVGADGVHLGRDDASYQRARQRLGEQAIIGLSCYNQLALAQQAEQLGASYVAFGACYPSPTKPQAARVSVDFLARARAALHTPICAIGGISIDKAAPLLPHADMLAVITDIYAAADPGQVARQYQALFAQT